MRAQIGRRWRVPFECRHPHVLVLNLPPDVAKGELLTLEPQGSGRNVGGGTPDFEHVLFARGEGEERERQQRNEESEMTIVSEKNDGETQVATNDTGREGGRGGRERGRERKRTKKEGWWAVVTRSIEGSD